MDNILKKPCAGAAISMFQGSYEEAVRGKVCSKPGVGGAAGCKPVREEDWGEWGGGGEGWSIPCGWNSWVTWWKDWLDWIDWMDWMVTYQPGEDPAEAREEGRKGRKLVPQVTLCQSIFLLARKFI